MGSEQWRGKVRASFESEDRHPFLAGWHCFQLRMWELPLSLLCHQRALWLVFPPLQTKVARLAPINRLNWLNESSWFCLEQVRKRSQTALGCSWARSVISGWEAVTSSWGQWPLPPAQLELSGDIFLQLNYVGSSTSNGQLGRLGLFPSLTFSVPRQSILASMQLWKGRSFAFG